MDAFKHPLKSFLMRAGMAVKTGCNSLFDLLRAKHLMRAHGDIVVLAHQQIKDIDIVFARLRPIHQKPRTGTLTQCVIHVFGIVREHPEGAVAPHDRIGTRKTLHQNGRNLQLPRRGLPVAPLACQLVDIINCSETDHPGIKHIIDKRLGVLTGFTLIAVDIIRAQVLIAKRIACVLTVLMHQPRHHLDQRCFTGAGLPIAHEGKDEPAQFRKGVQSAVKIIGHQHLGQLHRLIFGDVIAHDLIRLLEGHGQGRALGLARRGKSLHHKIIRFHTPRGGIERRQTPRG